MRKRIKVVSLRFLGNFTSWKATNFAKKLGFFKNTEINAILTRSLIYIPIYLYLLIKSRSNIERNLFGLLRFLTLKCPLKRSSLKAYFVRAKLLMKIISTGRPIHEESNCFFLL